jgi:acyl-homoserine lactone acylase PvdQ
MGAPTRHIVHSMRVARHLHGMGRITTDTLVEIARKMGYEEGYVEAADRMEWLDEELRRVLKAAERVQDAAAFMTE